MISFEKIDKYSLRYAALFRYVRFVHRYIYNSSYDIIGKENLPAKGEPTIVICNHQNGLLDALGILFVFRDDRQPVFIARADIFKKEIAAKLLRFMKIMPAFRTVDVERCDVGKSAGIFLRAARVLVDGGTVAIFPEAGHESCHHLGTFKKGFPRIAFKAAEESDYQMKVKVLPIANHYSDYLNFRQRKVMVIGKPIEFDELYDVYKNKPNDAYLKLNEKCRPIIKDMMLDIEDLNYYDQYDVIRNFYREKLMTLQGKKIDYYPNHLAADKQIVSALDQLKSNDMPRFEQLMDKTEKYIDGFKSFNLRDWIINRKMTAPLLLLKSLLMIIIFPFYLFGLIHNYIPFNASNLLTRKVKDHMLYASFRMVIGALISFPIFYIAYLIAASLVMHSFCLGLIYVLACFASLFIYYYYKIAWIKLKAAWHYLFLMKNNKINIIQNLKKELIAEMGEIMNSNHCD